MYHQVDRLRRDMRNNGRIYEDVAKILKESVVSCAKMYALRSVPMDPLPARLIDHRFIDHTIRESR